VTVSAKILRFAAAPAALLLVAGPAAPQQAKQATPNAPAPSGETLYYVPHTHWEGAVFKTREEYLQMGLPHILQALSLLERYPKFKFTLDQAAYVKPFLERYPERAAEFRKFVADGRLEMVGGMDVMPDDVKPGGELFVRQIQYGKRYFKDALGVDVTAAWMVDTFGHHPQMPQILAQAGFKSFWFCRGVPNDDLPTEFNWRGIDGTTIPAFWAAGFYGLFYGPPADEKGFDAFFRARYNALRKHVNGPERFGLSGVDVSEPEPYVPPLVDSFNARPDRPFTIRYSTPSEFAAVVAKRANTPTLTGDFNPIFPGTYSSRAELKQTTREIERDLLTAEKLRALAALAGTPSDETTLWRAWEPVLFNQTHDLASGVMTDHVYEDVRRGYDFATRLAAEMTDASWDVIAAKIDTAGDGDPIIVFNPLGWPRTDIAEVEVGFAAQDVYDIEVVGPGGAVAPSQIEFGAEAYQGGGIKHARIAILARDVPAVGFAVYHVLAKPERGARPALNRGQTIENDAYRVTVDNRTGAITSLIHKADGWEAISGPANVVARQEDKGDLWELYHGLDGGSYIAGTTLQPVPTGETALLSSVADRSGASTESGPVFSEMVVTHPMGSGTYATRIRLVKGVGRVEVTTEIVNREKLVRYQALFPTAVADGTYTQSMPFGSVVRPNGIEFPAQDWVDYGDGRHGVALLNTGEPGNLASGNTLILSLMRSHSIGGYGFGGGYEPGMTSESGYELGRPLAFHYALVPHGGDWRAAEVYRAGLEFNCPLIARKAAPHNGAFPAQWGLLTISRRNVVLTACAPGPAGTTLIRVYEAAGVATSGVRIALNTRVEGAWDSDLLSRPGRQRTVTRNGVQFDLHPYEIKTILVKLKR